MQGKETSALLHQQAVLHILFNISLPLHLLLLLTILLLLIILILFLILHYTPPFSPPSGSLESLPALPPRLHGPVQLYRHLNVYVQVWSPPLSRFQNNYWFKIIHRLHNIDGFHRYHKTPTFRLSNKL